MLVPRGLWSIRSQLLRGLGRAVLWYSRMDTGTRKAELVGGSVTSGEVLG